MNYKYILSSYFDITKNYNPDNDNELDIQMKQVQKTASKQGKSMEVMEKDIAILKKDSHPPIKNLEKRLKYLEKKLK